MAYVARIGKTRNAYKILLEKTKERDYLEDIGVRCENGVTLTSDE